MAQCDESTCRATWRHGTANPICLEEGHPQPECEEHSPISCFLIVTLAALHAAASICVNEADWKPKAMVSNNDALVCEPVFHYLLYKFDIIGAGDAGTVNGTAQPGWKTKVTCEQIDAKDYKDEGDDRTHNVGRTLRHYGPACCGDKPIICSSIRGAHAPIYAVIFAAFVTTVVSLLSTGPQ